MTSMIIGQLLNFCLGEWAKKNSKRRIYMISCNVNSSSHLVNSQEHMDRAVKVNGLAAVFGEMTADAYVERKAGSVKVKETGLVSVLKKQDAAAA